MTAKIENLPRNDVRACIKFYEAQGYITPDQGQVMVSLQDDPTELRRVSKRWVVRR